MSDSRDVPKAPRSGTRVDWSEKDALLLSSVNEHTAPQRNSSPSFPLLVAVVFVYISAVISHQPILQQYLYDRFKNDQSGTDNFTTPTVQSRNDVKCTGNSSSQSESTLQKQVSHWMMLIALAALIPGILSTIILGSYTDLKGRKLGLVLPTLGTILTSVLAVLVTGLDLPIPLLVLGNFLQGSCGFFGTVLVASFAYVSDVTEPGKSRTFRIAVLQCFGAVAVGLSSLVTGYFIKFAGYFYPMLIGVILLLFDFILIVFFIPESMRNRSDHSLLKCSSLLATIKTYTKRRAGWGRCLVISFLIVLTCAEMVVAGRQQIAILFLLGSPFCWKSVKIGLYSLLAVLVPAVSTMILIKPLGKILRSTWIIGLGMLSIMAELLLFGLANTDVMIFLSTVAGLLGVLPMVISKTALSRTVGPDEQGALFGGVSIVQLICTTLAVSIFNPIYQATVASMPGLVYLMMAGIVLLALVLVIVLAVCIEGGVERHCPVGGTQYGARVTPSAMVHDRDVV